MKLVVKDYIDPKITDPKNYRSKKINFPNRNYLVSLAIYDFHSIKQETHILNTIIHTVDVLIIGSGAAGMTTALQLSKNGNPNIALLCKDVVSEGSTYYAQGGVAAVLDEYDSIESHINDTLDAGAGLCHEEVVRFTVERSEDGLDFEFLTYVKGAGNSNTLRDYSYIDANPLYGVSYYRLMQTDYDGTSETFPMVSVEYALQQDIEIAVYPNPAKGKFFVDIKGYEGEEVLVVVMDMMGKEHFSKVVILDFGGYTIGFDPSQKLSSGVYMVIGSSNNKLYSKKLVIR